ncbi:MAG: hypothetical protein ACK4SZ_05490 [Allosphingosinicella sp.]|uniref:hypothetical protein n=1 Tax=Allosphingosinicella sp. TaxID=2823234 RepID=UPI0039482ADD
MIRRSLALAAPLLGLAVAGCATVPAPSPQDTFFTRLQSLCGKAYEGRLVTSESADRDMAGQRLVMHVADCSPNRIRIPFQVGEDRSRTWVITRTADGLRLKHDHRHEDGSEDVLTQYGGDTATAGSASRQEFPVDAESIALFRREGRDVSTTNVWAIEVHDGLFAYELRRPPGPTQRHFRVEFDLTRPAAAPPLPWGWQG